MSHALARPALHVLAAAAALLAFTWPFLVFERPIHVFVSLFVTWAFVIGLLFAFSRGREPSDAEGLDSIAEEDANG